jgi:hypothetical protein
VSRELVREKVKTYLDQGLATGEILSVGKVFAHPPKLTKQTDLFNLSVPGQPDGCAIFLYMPHQSEYRIALGGVTSGRKGRVYDLSMLAYFMWTGPRAEDADAANDAFIDSLVAWIEASRNCGTQAVSLGGDGSGVIFSWGEGPDPSSIPGGKDIQVHTAFPRDLRGQATQIFNVIDVAIIEILAT